MSDKKMLNALSTAFGATLSAKSIKTDLGRDRRGAMCAVYFNNKKAFEFNDGGLGGESEIKPIDRGAYEALTKAVQTHNVAQMMMLNGWEFMEHADKISMHTVLVCIAETLIYKHELDKSIKKIIKRTEKGFVIVNADFESYISFDFKGQPLLADVKKHPKGMEALTSRYQAALARAKKDGMMLLNPPEQLKALGLIA